jgi:hypothetical protein
MIEYGKLAGTSYVSSVGYESAYVAIKRGQDAEEGSESATKRQKRGGDSEKKGKKGKQTNKHYLQQLFDQIRSILSSGKNDDGLSRTVARHLVLHSLPRLIVVRNSLQLSCALSNF